jgi:hypothetical protein
MSDFVGETSFLYSFYWRIGTIFILAALLILTLILETYVVKTKYGFSILAATGTIFSIFLEIDLARIVSSITGLIISVIIFSIYVYVAKKSDGASRVKAVKYAICIFLLAFGHLMDSTYASAFFGFDTGIIAMVLMIMGITYYFELNYSD